MRRAGLNVTGVERPGTEWPETVGRWMYSCYPPKKFEEYPTFSVQGKQSITKCSCKRTEELKEWLRPDGQLCVRGRPKGLLSRIRAFLRKGPSNAVSNYLTLEEISDAAAGSQGRHIQLAQAKSNFLTFDWTSVVAPKTIQACTDHFIHDRVIGLEFVYAS